MESLQIHTDSRSYPVFVGEGVISALPNFLKTHFPSLTKVVIFTDGNVGERYLPALESVLTEFHPYTYIIPNGEYAKTFDVYQSCLTYCLEKKLDRKSLVIAFGGGAVGDLSGFVAATFMRGIPFVQMPTTILAHDSAVGGKVAINHPLGKNMIGAFYQPEAVFYDLNFLSSLSHVERRSGFAEVIKHGLIQDEAFYQWLLTNISDLTALTFEQLEYMLKKGIQIKSVIVSQDEKEKGIRAFLNFGHTLGHAIEAEAGYGKVTHGEAVLIGMLFALKLSNKLFNTSFHYEKFKTWVEQLGYNTSIPEGLHPQSLLERMKQDKKAVDGHIQYVLLERIGKPVAVPLDDQFLLTELKQFQQD